MSESDSDNQHIGRFDILRLAYEAASVPPELVSRPFCPRAKPLDASWQSPHMWEAEEIRAKTLGFINSSFEKLGISKDDETGGLSPLEAERFVKSSVAPYLKELLEELVEGSESPVSSASSATLDIYETIAIAYDALELPKSLRLRSLSKDFRPKLETKETEEYRRSEAVFKAAWAEAQKAFEHEQKVVASSQSQLIDNDLAQKIAHLYIVPAILQEISEEEIEAWRIEETHDQFGNFIGFDDSIISKSTTTKSICAKCASDILSLVKEVIVAYRGKAPENIFALDMEATVKLAIANDQKIQILTPYLNMTTNDGVVSIIDAFEKIFGKNSNEVHIFDEYDTLIATIGDWTPKDMWTEEVDTLPFLI